MTLTTKKKKEVEAQNFQRAYLFLWPRHAFFKLIFYINILKLLKKIIETIFKRMISFCVYFKSVFSLIFFNFVIILMY